MSALAWHPKQTNLLLFSCGPHVLGLDTRRLSLEEGELLTCEPASPPQGIQRLPLHSQAPVTCMAAAADGNLLAVGYQDAKVGQGASPGETNRETLAAGLCMGLLLGA